METAPSHKEEASAATASGSRPLKLERVQGCCVCGTGEWAEPIASGKDFEYESSPDSFVAKCCSNCGLVFLDPRPAMSELSRIYGSEYHAYDFSEEKFGLAYRVRSWLESRRLRKWCGHLPPGARIIDIGAGDGFHLKLLEKLSGGKWTVEGVDPDEHAIAAARAKGLKMHHGLVQDLELPAESYDFATLIMTIEHVDAPERLLENVAQLLKPGGCVGIITDNTGSPDFALAKRRHWGGYHFPRHWNLFSKASIRKLAENAGLEVVRIQTLVSPVNWTYTVHNWLKDKGAPRFLYSQFGLDKPLPLAVFTIMDSFLAAIGKGAILGVVLRKPQSAG
jgi:SAM-dependent methyltransferase